MSRILARVTRGKIRIGTTKGVLVLAVAGALFFEGVVVPPIPPVITVTDVRKIGGVLANKSTETLKLEEWLKDRENRLIREDQEIILIIKTFLDGIT